MEVRYIAPSDLRAWWPTIKPGLENILRKSREKWIPEDIYSDCMNNRATLWAGLENNHLVGFMVLENQGENLHVWSAWSLEKDYDLLKNGLECIKSIARQNNNKNITFSSNRAGWNKRAAEIGFRPRLWICEV